MTDPNVTDTLQHSVRRDDYLPVVQSGTSPVFQILIPWAERNAQILPAGLPDAPRARDEILRATVRADAQWSAAIGIAVTKVAAMAWDVKSDISLRSKRAQQLLLHADSIRGTGGWTQFLGKQVRDYTTQGNGCHFEVVRATQAYGSKILGINHLPSVRCFRTGDPERPIIYEDRLGRYHLLRAHEVVSLVDMPDSDDISSLGRGVCAAERAYPQIVKMAALERYVYQKISGSKPLAVHIVSGIGKGKVEEALRRAESQQDAQGFDMYMGAVVMSTLEPTAAPALVTIPLAELPDRFNAQEERDRADLVYANCIGFDVNEISPRGGQQIGVGAQTQVLHNKAKGRGLIMYTMGLTHALNELVLDDKTQFLFTERDLQDEQQDAVVKGQKIDNVMKLLPTGQTPGVLRPEQALQYLVDEDVVPKAFLPEDTTPTDTLSDTDKPEAEGQGDAAEPQAMPAEPVGEEMRFKEAVVFNPQVIKWKTDGDVSRVIIGDTGLSYKDDITEEDIIALAKELVEAFCA